MNTGFLGPAVATALTVYGIETEIYYCTREGVDVATALTVYGIETNSLVGNTEGESFKDSCNSTYRLRY